MTQAATQLPEAQLAAKLLKVSYVLRTLAYIGMVLFGLIVGLMLFLLFSNAYSSPEKAQTAQTVMGFCFNAAIESFLLLLIGWGMQGFAYMVRNSVRK